MSENQFKLDAYIAEKKRLGNPYDEAKIPKAKLALLVEIGELANSTRCFKDWSNKHPESKERILDETADTIHFCLRLMNFNITKYDLTENIQHYYEEYNKIISEGLKQDNLTECFNTAFRDANKNKWDNVITSICGINFILNYTPEDIEQAYLKKLKINHERQKNNY